MDLHRRHLLSDLRPWVCCQVSCKCLRHPYKTKSYKTKGDWIRHLQAQHEVHPEWDDKKCPFCLRVIEVGGDKMMRHVERHLHQLSLAALPANPGDDDEVGSEHDSDGEPASADGSNMSSPSLDGDDQSFQDHPLYKHADQGNDGLWHCPWEGEGYCDHQPSVLKADFEYVPALVPIPFPFSFHTELTPPQRVRQNAPRLPTMQSGRVSHQGHRLCHTGDSLSPRTG